MDVPSILFAPAHLMATFPLGVASALVLDVGFTEALAIPVFESVTMLNCWEASPAGGGRALEANLRTRLLKEATLRTKGEAEECPLSARPQALLPPALEDIKVPFY